MVVFLKVCTLATYSYFIACLLARQYTGPSSSFGAIDIYFPIGTVLELIFYVGLLKVSMSSELGYKFFYTYTFPFFLFLGS